MAKSKVRDERLVPREELTEIVREAVAASPGLTKATLRRALPRPFQRLHAEAYALLQELAADGRVHRWAKGAKERFFASEPFETLDQVVGSLFAGGPLDAQQLKAKVEDVAPGHGDLAAEWLKGALARGLLYERAPLSKQSKKKTYGTEPDVRLLIKPVITALRKLLPRVDALGISRQRLAEALSEEVGVGGAAVGPRPPAEAHPRGAPEAERTVAAEAKPPSVVEGARAAFVAALEQFAREHPPETLLSIRQLRARLAWSKPLFDETVLSLSHEGVVGLHFHDHAGGLSPEDRDQLVQDGRGNHFVGIVLRRTP